MARARPLPGLSPDTPFAEAAATAVEVRTEELFSFREAVLDTDDIERVHDMRVASRRLRAVLEIFATCFPRKPYRSALADVKALADALGERRDPDVQIALLQRVRGGVATPDRAGIDGLVRELRSGQGSANETLAAALAEIEAGGLRERLMGLAAAARSA